MGEIVIPVKVNVDDLIKMIKEEYIHCYNAFNVRKIIRKKAVEVLVKAIGKINIEPEITVTKEELTEAILRELRDEMEELRDAIAREIAKELVKRIRISINEK